jgi:flagellar protein FliO/FliZ
MSSFYIELLAVCLLAVAGYGLVLFVRRRQASATGSVALRVVSSTPLGPRERAIVLHAHDRLLLIGVTAQRVSLLADLGAVPSQQPEEHAGRPPALKTE